VEHQQQADTADWHDDTPQSAAATRLEAVITMQLLDFVLFDRRTFGKRFSSKFFFSFLS